MIIMYLLYKEHCYALSMNQTYTLGNIEIVDIWLPIQNQYEITTTQTQIFINKQVYTLGVHFVQIETIRLKLLILVSNAYFYHANWLAFCNNEYADVTLEKIHLLVQKHHNHIVFFTHNLYYINGKKQKKQYINNGDIIVFPQGYMLCFYENTFILASSETVLTKLSLMQNTSFKAQIKKFHRSPRFFMVFPQDKVVLKNPPTPNYQSESILKLIFMPLCVLLLSLFSYFNGIRGNMFVTMFVMAMITFLNTLHTHYSNRSKNRKQDKLSQLHYQTYLKTVQVKLFQLQKQQTQALLYHYPDIVCIFNMLKYQSERLFEKLYHHTDFFVYRYGKGQVATSYTFEANDVTTFEVQQLIKKYTNLLNMPLTTKLSTITGLLGNETLVYEQLHQILLQIAFFHSYHEVKIMIVAKEKTMWNLFVWLPHFIDATDYKQLLDMLVNIIKERKLLYDNQKHRFLPIYLLVITDMTLLHNHSIMEYFTSSLTDIYIYIIIIGKQMIDLPKETQTIIQYQTKQNGLLVLENGCVKQTAFTLDLPLSQVEKLKFIRLLANVQHQVYTQKQLVTQLSFLEMYQVTMVEQLQIEHRWQQNTAVHTLAVPIGVNAQELLYLDLHENSDGPHLLIGGTTGSGKSEFMQTYLLSLAINFSPYDVNFLLIDYKGGGIASGLQQLPHVVGVVTNLEQANTKRTFIAIQAELQKRQAKLKSYTVNHINEYNKLVNKYDKLAHLFIVVDEFAELKRQQPIFMDELIAIARIGRSLGIHLILATQKPSGVVNEQIWANMRSKIAFKVQSDYDSKEILKTVDAAYLKVTGRAYLQVGNQEKYELFQSAWSGKQYETTTFVDPFYEIIQKGNYKKVFPAQLKTKQVTESEFSIIAQTIKKIAIHNKVSTLLLPVLPKFFDVKLLPSVDFKQMWYEHKMKLKSCVGFQDLPHLHTQNHFYLEFDKTQHIVLFGSQGYGKTNFLQQLSLDLLHNYAPKQLQLFVCDFGGGLMFLTNFPHTCSYCNVEQLNQILSQLNALIQQRKQLFTDMQVTNCEQYYETTQIVLPYCVVLIDNYEMSNDSSFSMEFNTVLHKVIREGVALGIYVVMTSSRVNALNMRLLADFKTKLFLYLHDKSEASFFLGHHTHWEEIKGRGLIKQDEVISFQLACFSQSYTVFHQEIQQLSKNMCEFWQIMPSTC